jgi:hypothetical protein
LGDLFWRASGGGDCQSQALLRSISDSGFDCGAAVVLVDFSRARRGGLNWIKVGIFFTVAQFSFWGIISPGFPLCVGRGSCAANIGGRILHRAAWLMITFSSRTRQTLQKLLSSVQQSRASILLGLEVTKWLGQKPEQCPKRKLVN